MKLKLIVFDDSAVFGGHEVMALLAVDGLLAAGIDLNFYYAEKNKKLHEALLGLKGKYQNLSMISISMFSKKLQGIRNHFERKKIKDLSHQFRLYNADAVLCIQGDVELSSRGVLAGKALGIPTISYVPYAHTLKDMGAKFGLIRDFFNRYLLNAPDVFITITNESKEKLYRLGTRVPVAVVYNGIDFKRNTLIQEESRKEFNLPADKFIVALCGRLEIRQKGQDFLIESIARSKFLQENVLTLFVGDGPDEEKLKDKAARLGIADSVRFMGWCDTSLLYPAMDVLAITSRFEGMPLVMLEAISAGIPVLGTDRDGMKEILPANWRYPFGDHHVFIEKLIAMLDHRPLDHLAIIQKDVRNKMSVNAFQVNFLNTVIESVRKTHRHSA